MYSNSRRSTCSGTMGRGGCFCSRAETLVISSHECTGGSLVRQDGGVSVQVGHLLHIGGELLGILDRGIKPVATQMRL